MLGDARERDVERGGQTVDRRLAQRETRARIARRVGSARAEKAASSLSGVILALSWRASFRYLVN